MRQAYIVHILDQVLSERSIVAWNDKAIREEEDQETARERGVRITLDNVFDLAEEEANADGSAEDEESEEEEVKKTEGFREMELIDDSDMVKATQQATFKAWESRQDQALLRPKVLILTPFKQMAY